MAHSHLYMCIGRHRILYTSHVYLHHCLMPTSASLCFTYRHRQAVVRPHQHVCPFGAEARSSSSMPKTSTPRRHRHHCPCAKAIRNRSLRSCLLRRPASSAMMTSLTRRSTSTEALRRRTRQQRYCRPRSPCPSHGVA